VEWDPAQRPAADNYRFLCSAVAPRPVAWITTLDPATGVANAAPFSWYNAVSSDPPMVMTAITDRADGTPKDTVRNIRASGEYVVNVATRALAQAMVESSADYPPGVSEVEALGLATAPSVRVAPPRLAASPVHLECRLDRIIELGARAKVHLVLGEVVHCAADDGVLDPQGCVDPAQVTFVARMGGSDYVDTSARFPMRRPRAPDMAGRP
jgi:flavin reductase (DIM6/NTAB) family NADH-FMN oxidoreductase RutF